MNDERAEATPRVIRRYANRKLYDTATGSFSSLRAIERLVEQGIEVIVLDKATGEDVTARTFGQVLAQRGGSQLPLTALIRMPGLVAKAVLGSVDRPTEDLAHQLGELRTTVERLTGVVDALLAEGNAKTAPALPRKRSR